MTEATEVNAIVEGLPNPSLPNHLVNANHIAIKETHQILIAKAVLVESALGGGAERLPWPCPYADTVRLLHNGNIRNPI